MENEKSKVYIADSIDIFVEPQTAAEYEHRYRMAFMEYEFHLRYRLTGKTRKGALLDVTHLLNIITAIRKDTLPPEETRTIESAFAEGVEEVYLLCIPCWSKSNVDFHCVNVKQITKVGGYRITDETEKLTPAEKNVDILSFVDPWIREVYRSYIVFLNNADRMEYYETKMRESAE